MESEQPKRRRVLITRPAEQSAALAAAVAAAGLEPVVFPTIRISPPASWAALDGALAGADAYDWIVFTSANSVRMTMSRPEARRALSRARVAAVGTATARALTEAGARVDVVPADQSAAGLLSALEQLRAARQGMRVLFPQAAGGRELLRDGLERAGALVDIIPVYRTEPAPLDAPPPPFDAAVFASPSALRAFVERLGGAYLQAARVVVIGQTTAGAARDMGVRVDAVAETPDAGALVAAVQASFVAYRADVP